MPTRPWRTSLAAAVRACCSSSRRTMSAAATLASSWPMLEAPGITTTGPAPMVQASAMVAGVAPCRAVPRSHATAPAARSAVGDWPAWPRSLRRPTSRAPRCTGTSPAARRCCVPLPAARPARSRTASARPGPTRSRSLGRSPVVSRTARCAGTCPPRPCSGSYADLIEGLIIRSARAHAGVEETSAAVLSIFQSGALGGRVTPARA